MSHMAEPPQGSFNVNMSSRGVPCDGVTGGTIRNLRRVQMALRRETGKRLWRDQHASFRIPTLVRAMGRAR